MTQPQVTVLRIDIRSQPLNQPQRAKWAIDLNVSGSWRGDIKCQNTHHHHWNSNDKTGEGASESNVIDLPSIGLHAMHPNDRPKGADRIEREWEKDGKTRRDPVEQGDKEMPEFVTEENGHDTSHVDHPLLAIAEYQATDRNQVHATGRGERFQGQDRLPVCDPNPECGQAGGEEEYQWKDRPSFDPVGCWACGGHRRGPQRISNGRIEVLSS